MNVLGSRAAMRQHTAERLRLSGERSVNLFEAAPLPRGGGAASHKITEAVSQRLTAMCCGIAASGFMPALEASICYRDVDPCIASLRAPDPVVIAPRTDRLSRPCRQHGDD